MVKLSKFPYRGARYDVTLNLNLVDVAGNPMRGPPETLDFFRHGEGDIVWSKASEVPLLGNSQVGNDRFLHGRPYLGSLGLYDHRARFYEPGTQLFLEPDPLGPVDSPNLYQAFGFDGLNVVDPWGTTGIAETLTLIGFGEGAKALPALGATPAGAAAILTLGFSAYLTHLSAEAINVTADAELAWSRVMRRPLNFKKELRKGLWQSGLPIWTQVREQVLPAQVDGEPETLLPTAIDTSPEIIKPADSDSGPEMFLQSKLTMGHWSTQLRPIQ